TEQNTAAAPPSSRLRGQVAIVTGASSGIGAAIAEQLVARGVHVMLAARRAERLHALAARLRGAGSGETQVIQCDVREDADVRATIQQTLDRWGRLDILIANAGLGYRGSVVDGDIERWRVMLDTNVFGLLLTLKHGLPPMLERGSGQVVVMSSVAGRVPTPGGNAYCGTKAAATAIADSVRQEVAAKGIRVITIEPGVVISEFQEVALYTPEIVPNMLKGAPPLQPEDIGSTVLAALELPPHVALNEILVRPTGQAHP
ncbi:MAG: SDR family oxidoreductase, partial [Ktedonobacterales bacterium]